MARRKPKPNRSAPGRTTQQALGDSEPGLRIIGGRLRGRPLASHDPSVTRPMKHRVREAVFNLLGPDIQGRTAIDLFAGAGALGLEAISRGAAHATLIERHVPTAKLIEQNVASLGLADQAEVLTASAFVWARRDPLPAGRLLVFFSPPYDFYLSKQEEMLGLLQRISAAAPPDSVFVVEADERFDLGLLPQPEAWDVRPYPPAVIAIWRR